ncbi:fumarylacetoacetate hydrolase family protein, partial [Paracoccus sp. (in: a-proteobacteria)]|uniref:fumarylacetoacetate hydrolase family protein n=1 Tax=Paracoccus sp. TaxID=267 RepID=UPI0026DFC759
RLMPGDIIMTGTPAGVGAVTSGDLLDCEVEGLAPLRVTVGPPAARVIRRTQHSNRGSP